jgi:hypothetical protein
MDKNQHEKKSKKSLTLRLNGEKERKDAEK